MRIMITKRSENEIPPTKKKMVPESPKSGIGANRIITSWCNIIIFICVPLVKPHRNGNVTSFIYLKLTSTNSKAQEKKCTSAVYVVDICSYARNVHLSIYDSLWSRMKLIHIVSTSIMNKNSSNKIDARGESTEHQRYENNKKSLL